MKATSSLKLVRLAVEHQARFLSMLREYEAAGEPGYQYALLRAQRDFASFVWLLNRGVTSKTLRQGRVPQSHFWLLADDRFLGGSRLRHDLTELLEQEGGNIGYDIRPSARGRGHGTEILRLTLVEARAIGLDRVLVTCDSDNIASARVIEKNGGRLEDQRPSPHSGKQISRYWIDLPGTGEAS